MAAFFLNLDVQTMVMVLFSGNLVSAGLICAFYFMTDVGRDWSGIRSFFWAKAFQAIAYLFLGLRGVLPDPASVNMGNTLAFIGFYHEAVAILRILNEEDRNNAKIRLPAILAVCVAGFNILEQAYHDNSVRVVASSIGMLLIFSLPCLRLFISRNSSRFKRWTGAMYLCFIVMLVPRAIAGMTTEIALLSNTYIQSLMFLSMILLLVFSLPAHLLLIKEGADRIIANMATTDMLTGLANRHMFFDVAQKAFLRSRMGGGEIAVLFIDIDFFKTINDAHGHNFGDQVLSALGRTIRDCLRPTDISCRYGGEEFVILLHDSDAGSAVLVRSGFARRRRRFRSGSIRISGSR